MHDSAIGQNPEKLPALEALQHRKKEPAVLRALAESIAIIHLNSPDPAQRAITRIASILETIRLTKDTHRKAGTLAHGQKQWLEIGMLLAQEARDAEPTLVPHFCCTTGNQSLIHERISWINCSK